MSLKIIRAGIFDTIQDGGRSGYRHLGINPNGPMDCYSASLANALLGRELYAPLIEMHFPAPVILFQEPAIICITGANFSPEAGGAPLPMHQPLFMPQGSLLRFEKPVSGRWCYLALFNGLDTPPWLGSRSTNQKIGTGGVEGRTLRQNDCIPYERTLSRPYASEIKPLSWKVPPTPFTNNIDILRGSEWMWLTEESAAAMTEALFTITAPSDRMGYRLQGPKLQATTDTQLVSAAVTAGTVQLLPSGELIVLMADHQTTGGYPRIGQVTTACLPHLAQLGEGRVVTFSLTDLKTAEEAMTRQQKYLHEIKRYSTFRIENLIHASL